MLIVRATRKLLAHLRPPGGYNATRFIQMGGELGGAEAARHLLQGRNASDGFSTLWEHCRLEMSVEAHVLLPWYRELFTEKQFGTAEQRLREHRFDVDALLTRAEHDRPDLGGSRADGA